MIGRWYAAYVERMAAASGVLAFAVWLAVSVVLQILATFLSVPVVLLSLLAPYGMRQSLNVWLFLLCFFAARVVICVIPGWRVADRKGRAPWLWGALTFGLGQFALALLAALPHADGKP